MCHLPGPVVVYSIVVRTYIAILKQQNWCSGFTGTNFIEDYILIVRKHTLLSVIKMSRFVYTMYNGRMLWKRDSLFVRTSDPRKRER